MSRCAQLFYICSNGWKEVAEKMLAQQINKEIYPETCGIQLEFLALNDLERPFQLIWCLCCCCFSSIFHYPCISTSYYLTFHLQLVLSLITKTGHHLCPSFIMTFQMTYQSTYNGCSTLHFVHCWVSIGSCFDSPSPSCSNIKSKVPG
jgi:hypothetical protein